MRKKLFTFLLALAASVGLMNAAADDSGSCGATVTYSFNGTTGEMVISGSGPMTVYTSGSSLLPWKDYKNAITSVVVEDGVTSVSQYSFGQCTNLTTVVIGNDVETIGQFAFNDCGASFTSLTLGSSLKSVGMAAFLNAHGITTLTLPDGFETVGDYAFCRLEALQTLNIPSSVTSIGISAFYRCYPLATINCAAVTPPSLGTDAFGDIANKSTIPLHVPNGSVAAYTAADQWNAFSIQGYDPASTPAQNPSGSCGTNLSWELNTSTGVLTITGSGAMADWNDDTQLPWYSNRLQITSVELPEGLTVLGTKAFRGCTNLASINMTENYPAGLTAINQEAFCNTKLTSVTIPESVVTIGQDAFYLSKTITDVYCYADPNNLTWVDYYCDDFANDHATVCHVKSCYLDTYQTKWGGTTYNSSNNGVNLTFTGDLTGSCGGSTPSGDGDKLSGVFSISSTKAVNFSKGNLQYDSENQIWQFAANQWDYIGNAAGNNAITSNGIADNNGIVDMFCWVGASSSLEGIKQYGIIKSWSGYGSVAGEALKSDWGNTMGGDWRTLSKDEWIYLLTERTNAANLRTLGTVNGKAGLILMPDGWTASGVSLTVTTANYTTNDINTTNWATLEGQGCAFLPAAGCCMSGLFDGVGGDGSYWSSTSRDSGSTHAHRLHFRATDVDPTDFVERFTGMSVRLVSETAPNPTPTAGIPCTTADRGKVLCTDGSIYATVSEATAASKTAAAVITYVDTENNKGLAFALANESGTMDWETAKTTAAAHTPAVSGGTWTLPSKDDWNNMINAAGGYAALLNGFSAVGGTNIQEAWYWTSTEYDWDAFACRFDNGVYIMPYPTEDPCNVRACLAFDISAAPTPTDEQVPTNEDPENPSYHYSTFYHSSQNYALTNDGTTAFIADLSGSDLVLTEIAHGEQVIPANTAVILRKSGSADPVVLTPTEENGVSVNPDDNSLEGVDVATPIADKGMTQDNCYVLSGTAQYGVGFYRINGNTLKAHKAYVKYVSNPGQNNAPKKMRFVFNTTTGVESAQPSVISGQKLIENGQLFILRDGKTYNAMGQIVK